MPNKKQRMQNANHIRKLRREGHFGARGICPNCKGPLYVEGHFVPASIGEDGFFLCKQPAADIEKP